jgi:hypothetical protein
MFSLCNLAHFPTQVVEGKNKRLGQISHEKVKLGSHFPQGKVFRKIATLKISRSCPKGECVILFFNL